jgi:hypothetical protein
MLRDEGESYSRELCETSVDVTAARNEGSMNGCTLRTPLRGTNVAGAAIAQAMMSMRRRRWRLPQQTRGPRRSS